MLARQYHILLKDYNDFLLIKLDRLSTMYDNIPFIQISYLAALASPGRGQLHAPSLLNSVEQAEAKFLNYIRGVQGDYSACQFFLGELGRLNRRRVSPTVNDGIVVPDEDELDERMERSRARTEELLREQARSDAALHEEEQAMRRAILEGTQPSTSRQADALLYPSLAAMTEAPPAAPLTPAQLEADIARRLRHEAIMIRAQNMRARARDAISRAAANRIRRASASVGSVSPAGSTSSAAASWAPSGPSAPRGPTSPLPDVLSSDDDVMQEP